MMETTTEAPQRDRPLTDAELWRRVRVAEAESEAARRAQEQRSGRREEAPTVRGTLKAAEPERVSLSAIARSRSPWDAVKLAELPCESAAAIRYAVKGGGVVTVQPYRHDFDEQAIRNPNAMLASLMTSKRDWGGVAHVWGDYGFQSAMMDMGKAIGVRVIPSRDFQTGGYNTTPRPKTPAPR